MVKNAKQGTGAERFRAIDWLRGLSVLFMIECHALWLLKPELEQGWFWYNLQRINGLVCVSFLFAAGFAAGLVGTRGIALETNPQARSKRIRKTLTRIGQIFIVWTLFDAIVATTWRPTADLLKLATLQEIALELLKIDILQLIYIGLLLVWALMLMCRNRVWPAVVALSGLLLASLVFTPWASAYRGNALLTGFLNTSSGALFPPCPFIAYLLMGALLGIGAARATGGRRNVVVGLIAMTAVAWLMSQTPFVDRWWHSLGAWDNIQLLPNLFERVYKLGVIILVLCVIERVLSITGSILRPAIAGLDYLSRNAFLIYFVHLSLIYGFCGIHLMWRWHRKSTWDQYAWRLATLYAGTVLVCWAFARIHQAIADLRERAAAAEAEAPMLASVAEIA